VLFNKHAKYIHSFSSHHLDDARDNLITLCGLYEYAARIRTQNYATAPISMNAVLVGLYFLMDIHYWVYRQLPSGIASSAGSLHIACAGHLLELTAPPPAIIALESQAIAIKYHLIKLAHIFTYQIRCQVVGNYGPIACMPSLDRYMCRSSSTCTEFISDSAGYIAGKSNDALRMRSLGPIYAYSVQMWTVLYNQ
jgi:hypothetical protein